MLHFLENHDEQRIASPDFAGTAEKGKPAMVVSATISTSPTLLYFGQEVGEPGAERAGFGSPTRTSIFDYIGVPHHQRWMNGKKFDGAALSEREKALREFYRRLLNFTLSSDALMGEYREIHYYNKDHTEGYDHRIFSFVRWSKEEKLVIASNFEEDRTYQVDLKIPANLLEEWGLENGNYRLEEVLGGEPGPELIVENGSGRLPLHLEALESKIFRIKNE
jgi:glycosidase